MKKKRLVHEACPLCRNGTARVRFRMSNSTFEVVQCTKCRFARTHPTVPGSEIHRYYPPAYYGENNRRFHPVLERLVTFFRTRRARKVNSLMKTGSVLDVGCGRGHFLSYLRRQGWRTSGVELSEVAAKHAREIMKIDVHIGDFMTAPYAPDSFDVVIFWHVLEHMTNARDALLKARDLIRNRGLLIIAVPNFSSLQASATGRHWFHLDVPRHYSHFRSEVLLKLLKQEGFVLQHVDHFSVEQNIYGWIQSIYNTLGFEHNLLYNVIKTRSARDVVSPWQSHRFQTLLVFLFLPVIFCFSMLFFILEILFRRGGTVEVYARKKAAR
jgi:2-polyprenyl-3-methyl-5-hydroxy-6-metoxy-1,4-benzoquinol methylase